MKYLSRIQFLTSSSLKLIAIITMFIDHFGAVVVGQALFRLPNVVSDVALYHNLRTFYRLLRLIGRLAFPIFCFMLVEGFLHTRSREKYLLRLGLFALISEIPFDLAIYKNWYYPDKQNVFFTLFLGMLVMYLVNRICTSEKISRSRYQFLGSWLQALIIIVGIYLGYLLKTDYGEKGVFVICVLYLLRFHRPLQCLAGAGAMSFETGGPFGMIPVLLYNGQKGRIKLKYFFYWFYPVHLLLLAAARTLLLNHFL